jgi:GT2 family glycosyltransferase
MVTPHKPPTVGIVVLNWNGAAYSVACLRSLEQLDYPACRVVLVDNGSVDDSLRQIREAYPDLKVIANQRNLGFSAGSNVGIAYLLNEGCDYVLLLNQDTEVDQRMLQLLVNVGEGDPTIGILGPKIYFYDAGNVIWSAGGSLSKYGQPSHHDIYETDVGTADTLRDVDYVTGCAILVKRDVIEAVGALDERFFLYFEESEWCARARRAGFRVVYVPSAYMWHKIEQNARETSPSYHYYMTRNRLLYLRCSGADRLTVAVAMCALLRTALAWSMRPEHRSMRSYVPALLRGVGDFLIGRFGGPLPGL